jgi:hypothetical protein
MPAHAAVITSGVFVKNIALYFDRPRPPQGRGGGNAAALAALLRRSDGQLVWSPDTGPPARGVVQAYHFLAEHWTPDDRLFVFGAGRAAGCARTLVRLLGTVGVLRPDDDPAELLDHLLRSYAAPRSAHDAADWARIGRLAEQLYGRRAVTVDYLGLWHAVGSGVTEGFPTVRAGRHALAIDARVAPASFGSDREDVHEVWFRGAHTDLVRGRHASSALADIALAWVLDGAVTAGVQVSDPAAAPAPTAADALAGGVHPMPLRRVPDDAAVHASVECYLRAHPRYWRRLPARVQWADADWVARGERLVAGPPTTHIETPAAAPALASVS